MNKKTKAGVKKAGKRFARMMLMALVFTLTLGLGVTASAQEVDLPALAASAGQQLMQLTVSTGIPAVDTMFGSLTSFLFGIVKIVGVVATLFGIVQLGLSISNHDPSQRSQGFLFIAGGVVVFFAPDIITFLTSGGLPGTGSGGTSI